MVYQSIIIGSIVLSERETQITKANNLNYIIPILNMIKQKIPLSFEIINANKIALSIDNPSNTLLVGILLRSAIKANILNVTSGYKDIKVCLSIDNTQDLSNTQNRIRTDLEILAFMKKKNLYVYTPWKSINEEFCASIPFLDDVINDWTPGQAKAIFYSFLNNCKKKDLAHIMGQTSQNASRLLLLAKEKEIRNLLHRFHSVISSKISQPKEFS